MNYTQFYNMKYKLYWMILEQEYSTHEEIKELLEGYQQVNYQSRWNNLYVDAQMQGYKDLIQTMEEIKNS